jgi:hypothetical protein
MNPLDGKNSTHWAIAGLAGAGAIVNVNWFDLVNLDTGRAHTAVLTSAGISGGLGGNSASEASYTEFETNRPVNFGDFDLAGARLTSAGIGVIYSRSLWALTVFDRDNSSPSNGGKLAEVFVNDSGIGVQLQFSACGHGVLQIIYGNGKPAGTNIPLRLPNEDKFPSNQRIPSWTNIPKAPK